MTDKKTNNVSSETMLSDNYKLKLKEKIKTQTNKILELFNLKNTTENLIKPKAKALWILNYVEVLWLIHAEEGLEMFPFDMYKGTMKWNIEFDGDVPMMKKLKHVEAVGDMFDKSQFFESNQRMINEIVNRWYITESEISFLKKRKKRWVCDFIIENVPAVFIIADKNTKNQINTELPKKDPIILIKYGENQFYPVHSRDNSRQLDAKLAKLN